MNMKKMAITIPFAVTAIKGYLAVNQIKHRACGSIEIHVQVEKTSLKQAAQQTKLNFQPTNEAVPTVPPLHTEKFDMEKMR